MARQGIDSNDKFRRLAQAMHRLCGGMGEALARGLLEQLWDTAYQAADDNVGEAEDIEARAKWRGDPGELFRLLAQPVCGKMGFVEPDERGGYRLHDFWEHCPPWVKRKAQTEAKRKAAGKTISDLRREAASKRSANGQQIADQLPANGQQMVDRLPAKDQIGKGKGRDREREEGEQVALALTTQEPPAQKEPTKRQIATDILAELCAARKRVNPRARDLTPTDTTLGKILDRVEDGHTAADCSAVIATYEAECRVKPESFRWFNAETPFLPANFSRALANAGQAPPTAAPPREQSAGYRDFGGRPVRETLDPETVRPLTDEERAATLAARDKVLADLAAGMAPR